MVRLQAWTSSSLGMLLNTSMMELIRKSLVMGGPIGVSLSHAPYKKVQGIDIRAARRPYFLLPEVRQIGPAPILHDVGIV